MSTTPFVGRDERTVAVENASYKWGCIFLCFALLIDGAYRGMVRHEAAWDLLALACAPGAICIVYQACHKTLPKGWVMTGVLIALLGGVIGAIVVAIMLWFRS